MSIENIDVASYSTQKALTDAQNQGGVKLVKGQQDQKEAVLNILLSGIDASAPRAPEQSGQRLNITA